MALLSGWVRHAAFYLGRWALLLATVASPALAQSNGQTAPVEGVEKGMFVFSAWAGKPLNVFFVRPENIDHKTMPVMCCTAPTAMPTAQLIMLIEAR